MRVRGIFKPSDDPNGVDGAPSAGVRRLFDQIAPGVPDPEIAADHAGLAAAALSPELAGHLAQMSRFMALELEWCRRADLREIAIAIVHLKLQCQFGFQSRLKAAQAAGLSLEKLAVLSFWPTTGMLSEEERLVAEYADAVVDARVPDELFRRAVDQFGEKGTVELTAVVGFWSCWAMLLKAVEA